MKQSKEIVDKRHQQIIALLNKKNPIYVTELSQKLNVSELTVRRDFEALAKAGIIKRFHGGARLVTQNADEAPGYANKGIIAQEQKQHIAQVVAQYVKDGDTVFLNAGTTTTEIIKAVKNKHITVITNNSLASTFLRNTNASLISTGGEFNSKNLSYSGVLATYLINKIFSSVTVLGVNGLSASDGITTAFYPETMINQEFLKQSKGLKIVACDSSKLGKTFSFNTASISSIDIVITDSLADPVEVKKIIDQGVKVVIADAEIKG
ncbi:DeoR/GlpR transcriptional regulator [Treponema parvum]|uniref:DeoR/GlpR transcriptional regulator n=1 Tax=Treponema parvum TaxID=138851 RepID=A0A975F5X9_9SPIR|nr:DeoR/GlpR family DNA-binding transcription regulator [Treponema parvum]QTQ14589.1 DeoR/GlpR transcriptional regulator [Treponema parvum]